MDHRSMRVVAAICTLLGALVPVLSSAQETSQSDKQIVSFPSGDTVLSGYLYIPNDEGPFPVLLFNHGSAPSNANDRAFDLLGPYFAQRGWAFFAPYRRGQGLSSAAGPYIRDQIRTAQTDSVRSAAPLVVFIAIVLVVGAIIITRRRKLWVRATPMALIAAAGVVSLYLAAMNAASAAMVHFLSTDHLEDHVAAYEWLRDQGFVDTDRIATGGNSFGGAVTVFATELVPYCAAFSASGGSQSWARAPKLRRKMTEAVANSRAPIYFFQAANDYTTNPSETLGTLQPTTGQTLEFKIYPDFGASDADGHAFAWRGVAEWGNDVVRFLATHCE